MRYSVSIADKVYDVELTRVEDRWICRLNGRELSVDFTMVSGGIASILIDGQSFEVRRETGGRIAVGNRKFEVAVEDPRSWQGRHRRDLAHSGPQRLTASMPGKIVRVLAKEGDTIQAGQGIVVVEAMKMQNEIKSLKPGTLHKLLVREGANVNAGEVLAIVE